MNKKYLLLIFTLVGFLACKENIVNQKNSMTLYEKINSRTYPSVFMAWNPIDMPEYPLTTLKQRIKTAAKHDLLWEEPISQLGYGVDLVLGVIWDNEYQGLANSFTQKSLKQALKNREEMLKLNPNMVFLMEIRWRDAPGSYLPKESSWWMKNEDGSNVEGWKGGPEPYYMLNYENEDFQNHIAEQALVAIKSGVYDGIMLDWSGHLEIIKKIRKKLGKQGLIIVNIHDDIEDGRKYKDYINGAFMELNVVDELYNHPKQNARSWKNAEKALTYYENNFLAPKVNCFELWGERKDLRRMRAATTLTLTCSNGYVLYGDPNWYKEPDHIHDWYSFWDYNLGKPIEDKSILENGVYQRKFENGLVLYNPESNSRAEISFESEYKRLSNGKISNTFILDNIDGDIFIKVE